MIEKLRDTPTGFVVKVGGINVVVLRYIPNTNDKGVVCKGCALSSGLGARSCEYSKACMAHLRPDHESVVFAKIRKA